MEGHSVREGMTFFPNLAAWVNRLVRLLVVVLQVFLIVFLLPVFFLLWGTPPTPLL